MIDAYKTELKNRLLDAKKTGVINEYELSETGNGFNIYVRREARRGQPLARASRMRSVPLMSNLDEAEQEKEAAHDVEFLLTEIRRQVPGA